MKKIVNKGGRPTEKTGETVEKLEQAFMDGATITEACRVAQIDRKTYYNWLEADVEFLHKMKSAQEYIDSIARMNLARAIKREQKTDGRITDTSKWWAERRMKSEFSTRAEHTGKDGETLRGNTIVYQDFRENEADSQ